MEQELDKAWEAFLAECKAPFIPDAGFTPRVMNSVRDWEGARLRDGARGKTQPEGFWTWLRPWLDARLGPSPVLIFSSCLLVLMAAGIFIWVKPGFNASSVMDTRVKGVEFRIGFMLKRGDQFESASSGSRFHPGDQLQAVYSAPSRGYLHLLSIDGNGRVICFSCEERRDVLPPGRTKTLPYALELDSSPSPEVLVGIWSPDSISPFQIQKVVANSWETSGHDLGKIQESLRLLLPKNGKTSVFQIQK